MFVEILHPPEEALKTWIGVPGKSIIIHHDPIDPFRIGEIRLRDGEDTFHVFNKNAKYIGTYGESPSTEAHPLLKKKMEELMAANAKYLLQDTLSDFVNADTFDYRRQNIFGAQKHVLKTLEKKLKVECKVN